MLHKLFERIQAIEDDFDPKRTGKVFNVLGDVFPSNQLEKMIRDIYAHNQMDGLALILAVYLQAKGRNCL